MLSSHHVQTCINFMENHIHVSPPSVDTMNEILNSAYAKDFCERLVEYYDLTEPTDNFDTWEREMFHDIIAHRFTGGDWPCNMDGPKVMDNFVKKLYSQLKKEGWNFVSEKNKSN